MMFCWNGLTVCASFTGRCLILATLALSFSPGAITFGVEPEERKAATGETIDLFTQHKAEYAATEAPAIVEVGSARYLTITGRGEPSGEVFRRKTGALYGVAYGLKMKSKFAGRDYVVSPLEGLWWGTKDVHGFMAEPRETWNWKLLIRTPEFITEKDLSTIVDEMAGPKKDADARDIKLETLQEGRCVQILHVGPYVDEPETIATMLAFMKEKGLTRREPHHEIYLSDPNRTPPEELRTILRQPVK